VSGNQLRDRRDLLGAGRVVPLHRDRMEDSAAIGAWSAGLERAKPLHVSGMLRLLLFEALGSSCGVVPPVVRLSA
jgi:hypothetical protein